MKKVYQHSIGEFPLRSNVYHELQMRGSFLSFLRRQWPKLSEMLSWTFIISLSLLVLTYIGGQTVAYCYMH